jgi:hypothetical protein
MLKTLTQIEAESQAQVVAQVCGKPVTRGELSAAFDLVANRDNWKMPIDCTIQLTADQVALIREAVIFFAGCEATFRAPAQTVQWDNGDNMVALYHVTAPGYYAAVGA